LAGFVMSFYATETIVLNSLLRTVR
jgi:hypothetical protein